ncbi:hypothetical protein EXIGLDRAFT_752495 [Exidia glandulosa HHB12029]|uniref:Wings apart-like protein C-terminal domain-containing protein n=1 Tax=Exidia glandulosa HHB12029 TaxID=1314781 RepID=A0A165EIS2_EXIGL|nr:hypothetical protein EXIGLDRAFT_752495 [Exidia glandulosa HHB12029]
MKNHGETRRFLDEVGYLLEGLESPLLGVQRTSAIELLEKMCDGDDGTEFVRKARSADFLTRAWGVFSDMADAARDPILLLCMGVFCAIVSREPRDLLPLTETTLFGDMVTTLLSVRREQDLLRLAKTRLPLDVSKRLGLKRNEVPLLESVGTIVYQRSNLFSSAFPVTSNKVASSILAALPKQFLQPEWLRMLVDSAEREMNQVSAYLSAHLDDDFMDVDDDADPLPDIEHLQSCLRVLDSGLLGDDAADCEALLAASPRLFAGHFVHLCMACQLLLADGVEPAIADDAIDTTLRVLINLTNGSSQWCDALLGVPTCMALLARLIVSSHHGRKSFVSRSQGGDEDAADPLDRLCLALGLLTNLVQESSRTVDDWLATDIAWTCKSEARCLRDCGCKNRQTALHAVIRVYTEQSVKTEDDNENAEALFLLGHLAVLLALFAHKAPRAAAIVRADAPIGPLLTTCRDWVATFELSRRRLAATHTTSAEDAQRGIIAVKRAVDALAASV